jgi:hypothetical protein
MDIDLLETTLHDWECRIAERIGVVVGWEFIRESVVATIHRECDDRMRFVERCDRLVGNLGIEQTHKRSTIRAVQKSCRS